MTFKTPWAIDGARSTASEARAALFTAGGGRGGVAKPSDLRVLPLAVPGNGLRITSGNAQVMNHYLSDPDEIYTVANPSTHTVLAADMPPANPAVSYYLVCVVVGDTEFDQAGHPYMPDTLSPEDALDYEYVRPVIVPCSSTTTSFEELGLFYPALALARLEVPALTTTITAEMIVDVRELAQSRSDRQLSTHLPPDGFNLTSGGWTTWPLSAGVTKHVPSWATKAVVIATIAGAYAAPTNANGGIRVLLTPAIGSPETIYQITTAAASRETIIAAFSGDVSSLAGQDISITIEGYKSSGDGHLTTFPGTNVILDVQFSEDTL